MRGFLTDEVREAGERVGFRIETFDGRRAMLARAGARSPHRVGRYGVDLAALDALVEPALGDPKPGEVFLVDEIGKMECLSPLFVVAMTRLLDSGARVVATVALKGAGFMAAVKKRPGAELWTVTRANRDELPARILSWLDR